MKETLICKLDKHCIYYLNNSYYGFYIFLPIKDFNETNITIRLKSNYQSYDLSKNNLENVKVELMNYYQSLDNSNITLILPVFYDDSLNRIATIDDLNIYQRIDMLLGDMFNKAYMFLNKNGIKVNPIIYFIKNETFNRFTNWFVNRYGNRIQYKTLADLVNNNSFTGYNTMKTPNVNFVVGTESKPSIDKTRELSTSDISDIMEHINKPEVISEPVITPNNEVNLIDKINSSQNVNIMPTDNITSNDINNKKNDKVGDKNKGKNSRDRKEINNSGFVSYLLLGIGTFIVSLVLLYALIK